MLVFQRLELSTSYLFFREWSFLLGARLPEAGVESVLFQQLSMGAALRYPTMLKYRVVRKRD